MRRRRRAKRYWSRASQLCRDDADEDEDAKPKTGKEKASDRKSREDEVAARPSLKVAKNR
jgi:hypothetical protein